MCVVNFTTWWSTRDTFQPPLAADIHTYTHIRNAVTLVWGEPEHMRNAVTLVWGEPEHVCNAVTLVWGSLRLAPITTIGSDTETSLYVHAVDCTSTLSEQILSPSTTASGSIREFLRVAWNSPTTPFSPSCLRCACAQCQRRWQCWDA